MASELTGKSVMSLAGQKLGTVKMVILDGKEHAFLIVTKSGNAGQLAMDIPIPAQNVRLEGNQVANKGLSQAQIDSIKEYKSDPNYRTVMGDQQIPMSHS